MLFRHGLRRKDNQHSLNLGNSLFLSLFFFLILSMFTCLPYSSYIVPATIARDTATISQTDPMIIEEPAKLRVLR
jgi:hypothetical protein